MAVSVQPSSASARISSTAGWVHRSSTSSPSRRRQPYGGGPVRERVGGMRSHPARTPRGTKPGDVIDSGLAVVAHRGHRRVPQHAQLLSSMGSGVLSGPQSAGHDIGRRRWTGFRGSGLLSIR
jgi:hypothetical protein